MPDASGDVPSQRKRFLYANSIILAFGGSALLWLSRDARVDFAIANLFFDPARAGFYLRDAYWLSTVAHDALKWFALAIWVTMLGLAVASLWIPRLQSVRANAWWFCGTSLAAVVLVAWLKSQNAHACPWDIDLFGGIRPWYPLLDAAPTDRPGRCWPGGHAAGGFALLAGYYMWRDSQRSLARFWLALSLALGAVMSAAQIARGAHFLSHNLWTLWWCVLVCASFYSIRRGLSRR